MQNIDIAPAREAPENVKRKGGRPPKTETEARRQRVPPKLLNDYVSEDDAAAEVGIHKRTLRRSGAPYVDVGGRRYHPIALFKQWLARRTRGARGR
jgi:hypothetical protein